jgi:hypothetical protein
VSALPTAAVSLLAALTAPAVPPSPTPPTLHPSAIGSALVGADCSANPNAPECHFSIDGEPADVSAGSRKPATSTAATGRVCHDVPVFTPATKDTGQAGDGTGANGLKRRDCSVNGLFVDSTLIFYRTDPSALDAQQLAQRAEQALVMPRPAVEMSPEPDVAQLTGLPVWLWLEPGAWAPKSVTLSANGVTVTATATPQRVVWNMGDGSTVTCAGAGTPFPEHSSGDAMAPSPTCGHTFHRTSEMEPGGAFHVTATVVWRVDWTGFGPGGTFPDLESSVGFPVRVIEAAALVTNSR